MRILEDVYLVGSGSFGLSHPTDPHVYLIDGGSELALIDTGSGVKTELIMQTVEQEGFSPRDITLLINTHSDWDHARGNYRMKQLTDAKTCIHEIGVPVVQEKLWPEIVLTKKGIPSYPVQVDRVLNDGDVLQVGRHELQVLYTPGHTNDHIAVVLELRGKRVLFCGDMVLGAGAPGIIRLDANLIAWRDSLRRMRDLDPDALLCGHNIFTLSRGREHIAQLVQRFETPWADIAPGPGPFLPSWWLMRYPELIEDAREQPLPRPEPAV
ncbi:MAG: MBL fold metallo-hydrolase [Chloroflexi bacterium]|nr:MBL fold metallo-hydrolase [Chloroflexota bacterium]